MAFTAYLIILFATLLSGCLPRSKHPGPTGEELLLGVAAERSGVAVTNTQSGVTLRPANRAVPTHEGTPAQTSQD